MFGGLFGGERKAKAPYTEADAHAVLSKVTERRAEPGQPPWAPPRVSDEERRVIEGGYGDDVLQSNFTRTPPPLH